MVSFRFARVDSKYLRGTRGTSGFLKIAHTKCSNYSAQLINSKNILRHEHALWTIYVQYQVHVLRKSPIRTLSH